MEVKDWLKQDAFSFEQFYGEAQKEEKEEEKERAGADRNTCGGKRIKRGTGTGRAKTGA